MNCSLFLIVKTIHSNNPACSLDIDRYLVWTLQSVICQLFSPACCLVRQLITEQALFTLPRGAEIEGKCGSTESEIHITWKDNAYTLRIYFSKVGEKGSANNVYSVSSHAIKHESSPGNIKRPAPRHTSPKYTYTHKCSGTWNLFG